MLMTQVAHANIIFPPLNVKEKDESPDVIPVFVIQVSGDMTVTDEGNNVVTLSVDAAGAGGLAIGDTVTGGTENLIHFTDSSGNLAQDISFKVIPSTDSVEVAGSSPRVKIRAAASPPGFEFHKDGSRKWLIFSDATNDRFIWKTDTDERLHLLQGGQIGINTQGPNGMLHIVTNATTEEGLRVQGSASQTAELIIIEDSAGNDVWNTGDGEAGSKSVWNVSQNNIDFQIRGDGISTLFFLDASEDRIGIGLAAPSDLFHIQSADTGSLYIDSTTASKGGRIVLEDTDGAGCTAITALNGTVSGTTITCP